MSQIHPQLAAIVSELRRASEDAHTLATSVDESVFLTRPVESVWSMAECVAHLTLTTRAYLPIIDAALATPGEVATDPSRPFKADVMGRLLRWTIEPPYRMRVPTLPAFVPQSPDGRDTVLGEFDESQAQLVERVHAANGRELGRLRIVSPFNARMKYNLYSCFKVLPAHQRRHVWQACRVKERVAGAARG